MTTMIRPRPAPHPRPVPLNSHLLSRLELIEAAAWADVYQSATSNDARALGLRVGLVGPTALLAAAEADVLALNRAVGLGVHRPATALEIEAVASFFAEAGATRYFVQVSPAAQPDALAEHLRAHGLRHHNNWVKLVRTLDHLPTAETDLRIERLDHDRAGVYADLLPAAFDWPETMRGPLARTVGRGPWHHYAAYDGDEIAAVAAMFVVGDTAYLGPAMTRADFRGRGAQSAFIARRLRDAAALGAALAVTETAEERPERPLVQSYRNMRRLGFEVAYARPNYIYDA